MLGLNSSSIFGQEKSSVKKVGKTSSLHAYIGFGGGGITSVSDDENEEFSKSGYSLGLSAAFSRKTSSVIIEGAAGWRNSRLLVEKDKDFVGRKELEVRTDYIHLDIAPMLKISSSFWAGPLFTSTLGTDTTFSPVEEHDRPNYYIGLQGNYYAGKKNQHRINMQLMTDVSIRGRQIFLLNLNYHIGMELFEQPKYVVKTVYKKSKPVVVTETKVEEIQKYQYLLDAGIVNFATGKYEITSKYQSYLTELASYLQANASLWRLIYVRSHTDFRGGAELNKELSQNRADAVISYFIGQNIDKEKIKIHSNSFNDPVQDYEDDVSLAKNRRVEIIIVSSSSRDAVKLNQKILNIKQRNRLPTTCLDGVCQ